MLFMKKLITHVRPHLDDICGMWLLKKYVPAFRTAGLSFVSATMKDPGDPNRVFVGLGRRRFDEHKGDIGESAASLVWIFVRPKVKDRVTRAALDRLVLWVRDEDRGMHDLEPNQELLPTAQIRAYFDRHGRNSATLASFGFELLEGMYSSFENSVRLDQAWKKRKEFRTRWGRGVALKTAASDVDQYSYKKGAVLLVLHDTRAGFRHYRASAKSRVNLTSTYRLLREIDPRADWYLHHPKKLLLSGSDVAPDTSISKLPLRRLIDLVRA